MGQQADQANATDNVKDTMIDFMLGTESFSVPRACHYRIQSVIGFMALVSIWQH